MRKGRTMVCLLGFLFCVSFIQAQSLFVRVYSTQKIVQVKIQIDLGKYEVIFGDSTLAELSKGDFIQCEYRSEQVVVKHNGKDMGSYSHIELKPTGFRNIIKLSSSDKAVNPRTYDDGLIIHARNNQLLLLNNVNLENYIAGVVQSEIYGKPELIDIFKVQATISRTYALRNINKHILEGYNLCDDVHCQVYKNRCIKPEVLTGVLQSSGEVLVDSVNELIDTPFHSNSGGETVNSEDVWSKPVYYLRASADTFSFSMRNSLWEKRMQKEDWLKFFANTYNLNIADEAVKKELLNFCQDNRKATICSIPLKQVRVDLKLKSTFFSVEDMGSEIKLNGRGYGHGVGLSQEGAIRMVELGYKYNDILMHYYTGAKLIHVENAITIEKGTNNRMQGGKRVPPNNK